MTRATLKAGKYYIGDPCYLFGDSWDKVLGDTKFFGLDEKPSRDGGLFKIFGHDIFVCSTAYGDGVYSDQDCYMYGVDAGLIGILPYELIKIDNKVSDDDVNEYGRVIEFQTDFECSMPQRGVMDFGGVEIDTRDEEEDDE